MYSGPAGLESSVAREKGGAQDPTLFVMPLNHIDVERQHSRSVRAIYEHIDSTPRKLCDDFADGKNQASLAGDMINERQPSAGSGRLQYLFDDEVRIRNRERNLRDDHVRSAALSYEIHRIPTRVVTMIGDQNLVTGIELK